MGGMHRAERTGRFLRPHTPANKAQHQSFLEQLDVRAQAKYLHWFRTLPLWIETEGLRVVHACWHESSVAVVRRELGASRIATREQLVRALTEGNPLYEAIEVLLKGPEISLVDHGVPAYWERSGHRRPSARLKWWDDQATTLRALAEPSDTFCTEDGHRYPEPPDIEIEAAERSFGYSDGPPVVYGHYWRRGRPEQGRDWTRKTACVDFSAVRGGSLVAYRWSGEGEILLEHYVSDSWPEAATAPTALSRTP
jgi:hypothetical protein